jgi:peptidoglycan/LPS O-acetylase OafA/YrhL
MSRNSQVIIGLVLLLLCAAMTMMALGTGEPQYLVARLGAALVAGALGFACSFEFGRPLTTRISLGVLSLGMLGMVVHILLSNDRDLKSVSFAVLVAVMSGAYAFTGYYPNGLPMSEVFGKKPDPAERRFDLREADRHQGRARPGAASSSPTSEHITDRRSH